MSEREKNGSNEKIRKKGGVLNRVIFFMAAAAVVFATYIGLKGYEMYSRAVSIEPVADMAAKIRGQENFVTLDELPDIYAKAVVSVEDKRFYKHGGIDIRSIGRAALINLKDGGYTEGGSTITQQIAKNEYFTQEKKLVRKAAEIFAARDIEKELSKNDILELYINSIYYGDGRSGIYDASMHYFGVPPSELDDFQCVMLAGIPNAPSVYAPTVNPELAADRQRQVAEAMVSAGAISETEKEAILAHGKM